MDHTEVGEFWNDNAEAWTRMPRFTHTMSYWINLLVEAGFRVDQMEEPRPSDEAVGKSPALQDAQVYAQFLHIRVRK